MEVPGHPKPEIRARIESAETFRGYRSMTVAFTGCLAVLGAIAQPLCLPDPRTRVSAYLILWIGIAVISMGATAAEMVLRCVRLQSDSQTRLTRLAAAQFMPSVLVGALVTATLVVHAPDVLWMLPGLYGALGAMMFFMRNFLDPLLPEPSVMKVVLRVCMGMFAGVSVAWVWAPSALIQCIGITDVSIAALTLAFLVGFGIEVFFALLDKLVTMISGTIQRQDQAGPT